eukprot:CAMPEP_0182483980 /NCGR_PEP_ID=MMETSP1319-20130603/42527_1 /TAXON_ID=172717 /ORGANISM="Bolidomonas pacifica, Strain RCC208" /LENGTH=251 /DNA_ID=CAMNT_0024685845 /DNA_START=89 /DNA_END=842 /DNA_ORIENTATION=+
MPTRLAIPSAPTRRAIPSACVFLVAFALLLTSTSSYTYTAPEQALLNSLTSPTASAETIRSNIETLCSLPPPSPNFKDPAAGGKLNGRWELVYQSSPSTSSPVQRLLTSSLRRGVSAYDSSSSTKIFQDVDLTGRRAIDIVVSAPGLAVNVTALAGAGCEGGVPGVEGRRGSGRVLGLNVLGVSSNDPEDDTTEWGKVRVDFLFDAGEVTLWGRKFPYPVPFRLKALRDNFIGWIDTVYLGEALTGGDEAG